MVVHAMYLQIRKKNVKVAVDVVPCLYVYYTMCYKMSN